MTSPNHQILKSLYPINGCIFTPRISMFKFLGYAENEI